MTVIVRRPPLLGRIWCAVFCTGLSITLIVLNTGYVIDGQAAAWAFAPLAAMVGALMAFAWRFVTLSFRAGETGLVIHNVLRTRRVPLSHVVGFDVGGRMRFDRWPERVMVRVETVSGTYPIGALGSRHFMFARRHYDIADELQAWLDDTRAGLQS
jgi:hypothetical protein